MTATAERMSQDDQPPLIAHVLFHFGVGGLENGVVNLINRMPRDAYRHAIVCVAGASDFHKRLTRDDVPIIRLEKASGIELGVYVRAWRAFRSLRPAIVHTRNLAALEMQVPAWLAGVACRVHSEHGRDGRDLNGDYRPYNLLRKLVRPLVHRYLAVSRPLREWLIGTIGVGSPRVAQIYNGVDTARFTPRSGATRPGSNEFLAGAHFVVGAVGRMVPVKDHLSLVRAFALLSRALGADAAGARLVIVGDGPLRAECEAVARAEGIADRCWFAGERDDVPEILRMLDVFCLTSLNEGINNTLLEAMASGLPAVATAVGGNLELVVDRKTGRLVPPRSPEALCAALLEYAREPAQGDTHGRAGRARAECDFSLDGMVAAYMRWYDGARNRPSRSSPAAGAQRHATARTGHGE